MMISCFCSVGSIHNEKQLQYGTHFFVLQCVCAICYIQFIWLILLPAKSRKVEQAIYFQGTLVTDKRFHETVHWPKLYLKQIAHIKEEGKNKNQRIYGLIKQNWKPGSLFA